MKRNIEKLNEWFDERHVEAKQGLDELKFELFMEVKMYPEEFTMKSDKQELKDLARESTIHTFGWPIAVCLDSKPENSPQPTSYGIKAQISIGDSDNNRDKRYDYWALKKDGAFYLLKSLFEDSRKPGYLFFNTRIIRITEVLMYALNLYSRLGLNEDKKIIIEIKHSGLIGLTMEAVGNRSLYGDYKNYSGDDESLKRVKTTIKEIDGKMPNLVERFVKPLFEIFNWFRVEEKIIEEIVLNYRQGKVT